MNCKVIAIENQKGGTGKSTTAFNLGVGLKLQGKKVLLMRKLGLFSPKEKKPAYKPKPYQQMTYPGQRIQVDVKVVPRHCIADPELRLYQYTAIDEFTRLRFLLPTQSSPPIPPPTS